MRSGFAHGPGVNLLQVNGCCKGEGGPGICEVQVIGMLSSYVFSSWYQRWMLGGSGTQLFPHLRMWITGFLNYNASTNMINGTTANDYY